MSEVDRLQRKITDHGVAYEDAKARNSRASMDRAEKAAKSALAEMEAWIARTSRRFSSKPAPPPFLAQLQGGTTNLKETSGPKKRSSGAGKKDGKKSLEGLKDAVQSKARTEAEGRAFEERMEARRKQSMAAAKQSSQPAFLSEAMSVQKATKKAQEKQKREQKKKDQAARGKEAYKGFKKEKKKGVREDYKEVNKKDFVEQYGEDLYRYLRDDYYNK